METHLRNDGAASGAEPQKLPLGCALDDVEERDICASTVTLLSAALSEQMSAYDSWVHWCLITLHIAYFSQKHESDLRVVRSYKRTTRQHT